MRSLLVAAEVALSVVLVIGAGLLLRTFWDLLHVDPGFSSENVLAANVWLPVPNDPKTDVYGTNEQRAAFSREVLRRLRGISGVEDAAISSALPLRTPLGPTGFRVEGISEQGDAPSAIAVLISPDFFTVMRTSLIRGKMFSDSDDPKAPPAVLVDQAAARYFWHGQDPIGRRIRLSRDIFVNGKLQSPPWMTVTGVVDDIKFSRLDEKNVPHLYANLFRISGKVFNIVVRGKGDPAALGRNIQSEIQSVDPNLPVSDVTPLTQVVTASVAERRFAASLIGAFAVLALVLAGVGVYGVATYCVQQRMSEFGIRSALGASTHDLVRMVLRDSMIPVLGGVLAGLLAAALAVRLIATLLFGVRPVDLPVYLIATFVLAAVGVLANYVPALRAGRVDPNIALRSE